MNTGLKNEELLEKAEFIMAVKDWESEGSRRRANGMDFFASQRESDDKILLRVITNPESRSGTVGIDIANQMIDTLENENYDKGVLIGRKFSAAARGKMKREGVQIVSENVTPKFDPQTLYFVMQDYINELCKVKCGLVPKKESDCEGISDGHYSCQVRLFSDNAAFHFERGWITLLGKDLTHLTSLRNSIKKTSTIVKIVLGT